MAAFAFSQSEPSDADMLLSAKMPLPALQALLNTVTPRKAVCHAPLFCRARMGDPDPSFYFS